MPSNNAFPLEFDAFLNELTGEPADVLALWRYAIFLYIVENENARILEMQEDGATLHLVGETDDGERFAVMRPDISEEEEQELLETIRAILGSVETTANPAPMLVH